MQGRFKRMAAVASALTAACLSASSSAQTLGGGPAAIESGSPLLQLDPATVAAGKVRIAKLERVREATTRAGEQRFPAFKVIGNTYSVGTNNYTAYLIRTSAGLILMDTTFERTAPWVLANIRSLGFDPADIRVIVVSHAHADHVGGLAWFKRQAPKAELYVMDADADAISKGVPDSTGQGFAIPAARVDHVLKDGDTVTLGDATLKAWKTAGHTPGTTTWEWHTMEGGKNYTLVNIGSNEPPVTLLPERYPGIVADQVHAWTRLVSLRPDVWFGGHAWQHDNADKYAALQKNPSLNPFVDPVGYRNLIAARAADFLEKLRRDHAKAGAAR